MATGSSRKKNRVSILTSHIIIICVSTVIFFFLSNHLTLNAQGGLLGTEVNLEELSKENMNIDSLKHIHENIATFMKVLTCSTIACI